MRRRVAAIGITTLAVLGAVVGAVAASPGPAVELRANSAAVEKETEKYLGEWFELRPDNSMGDATGTLRLIGTEKDPSGAKKPNLLTGKVDFGGEQHCPADVDAAASKAVETIKEKSKSFDPDGKGQKDGYNPNGEAEVTDSSQTAGDFRAVVEDKKQNGETVQKVNVKGTDPACAVGDSAGKARKDELTDLIYKLLAYFSRAHGGSGAQAAADKNDLGERFSGMLETGSSDPSGDARIAVQADLIR